jgi:multidrug efflux pump subunit AcrA (membrane-fusion protein)
MTANLDILTAEKTNVLIVPTRAVYSKADGRYVKVLDADNQTQEVKVEVGLRGVDGTVEIISGLNEGDKVSL